MATPEIRTGLRSTRLSRGRLLREIRINGSIRPPSSYRRRGPMEIWAEALRQARASRMLIFRSLRTPAFRKKRTFVSRPVFQNFESLELWPAEHYCIFRRLGQPFCRPDHDHFNFSAPNPIGIEA